MEKKKKSNLKTYIIFAVILVCSFIVGFFSSMFFEDINKEQLGLIADSINNILVYVMPILHLLVNAVTIIGAMIVYVKAKKDIKNWNGEDDSIEKTETKIVVVVAFSSISLILGFVFYGINAYYTFCTESFNVPLWLITLGTFLWSLINGLLIQKLFVDLIKKINPEKKGNIFSVKFNKDWIKSCDEAEKLAIYKCGHKAYRVGFSVAFAMWLITFIGMMSFDTGVFPLLCVSIIDLSLVVAYAIECIKFEYRGKK